MEIIAYGIAGMLLIAMSFAWLFDPKLGSAIGRRAAAVALWIVAGFIAVDLLPSPLIFFGFIAASAIAYAWRRAQVSSTPRNGTGSGERVAGLWRE